MVPELLKGSAKICTNIRGRPKVRTVVFFQLSSKNLLILLLTLSLLDDVDFFWSGLRLL